MTPETLAAVEAAWLKHPDSKPTGFERIGESWLVCHVAKETPAVRWGAVENNIAEFAIVGAFVAWLGKHHEGCIAEICGEPATENGWSVIWHRFRGGEFANFDEATLVLALARAVAGV